MSNNYLIGKGIYYMAALKGIRKKKDEPLQPVFEALTNSLESIKSEENRVNNGLFISPVL